jgi:arsenite methyltransferase
VDTESVDSGGIVDSSDQINDWYQQFLSADCYKNGEQFNINGKPFEWKNGIPRSTALLSDTQTQTEEAFGFKWKKRDTFDSEASLKRMREWLIERYGNLETASWLNEHGESPLMIDAGCGAGMSALELLSPVLQKIRYFGIDVSEAVDVAKTRFEERGLPAAFMQADICGLPFADNSVDLIFSEGVLHHTDSTKNALLSLARLLKPGGRFLFYVYKKKGPLREYTDDYVRDKLQAMQPQAAWEAMEPLTQLGISLGELDAEIDIPEAIDLLGIPAGKISVQRLFYWHVAKTFFDPNITFDDMNHINYDWYAPANAYRQSPEEIRDWCKEAGLEIEREDIQEAGITIIARKSS